MFYIDEVYSNGPSKIWYKKVNILDHSILLDYFKTLTFQKGDYKGRDISREQRWYHRDKKLFHPKWGEFKRWHSFNYDHTLDYIETKINRIVKQILFSKEIVNYNEDEWISNSILINKYENGNNIIPKHRDSETIFGDNPIIAIYSVGSPRTMRFQRVHLDCNKSMKDIQPIDIVLEPNSLLIMSGSIQKNYTHEILREPHITEQRYSLTFRKHVL
jgi:alkylated DNA repair dioxygenase AlkB